MQKHNHRTWINYLKGGFAFMTAPFAGHPLDKQRAIKMFYMARVNNIKYEEIFNEVENHLLFYNWPKEAINKQIDRVKEFLISKEKTILRKKKRAWLITWEYRGEKEYLHDNKVISIRDLRTSSEKIVDFIEHYYISTKYKYSDKMFFCSRKKINPYPVVADWNENISHYERITKKLVKLYCGDDPYIYARVVENLSVVTESNNIEKLIWDEIDFDDE